MDVEGPARIHKAKDGRVSLFVNSSNVISIIDIIAIFQRQKKVKSDIKFVFVDQLVSHCHDHKPINPN